eukprot:GSChrysophyteH1.ASY1.ANO1.2930.1 assembled CDS
MSRLVILLVIFCLLVLSAPATAKSKPKKEEDPKECEVCVSNLEQIASKMSKEDTKDKQKVEAAISKHCTKKLTNPKDVKMCYYFEPIKKAISQPFSTGMPKRKVCNRLKKDNPEICEVKYPIKVEKKEGEETDYGKLRVKQLKTILDQRGVRCTGCTEKIDFVKKCQSTEHLEM